MQNILSYFMAHPSLLYLSLAIFSLSIGSFLNVLIYRMPKIMQQQWQQECQLLLHPEQAIIDQEKLSLSSPSSNCPHCHHAIRWYQNIPILSWIILAGKCAYCQQAISRRYPLIELLSMLCSCIVLMVFGPTITMLCALILTYALIALSFIDLDQQLLPDRLTLPLAALGLAINSFSIFSSPVLAIWGYIIGFLSLWIIYYLFKLCTGKEGMGYGDFKLLAALGAWMGPMLLLLIVLLSSILGALVGLYLIKRDQQKTSFAFGPYLAIAGWIALLWGQQIIDIWLN